MTVANSVRIYTHKGHDRGVMQLHFGRNFGVKPVYRNIKRK